MDGLFIGHLHFCSDYARLHLQGHSPRVLLLHSICGVGETWGIVDGSFMDHLHFCADNAKKHAPACAATAFHLRGR
jgi:hypothetical protein